MALIDSSKDKSFRQQRGRIGEDLAALFLQSRGFELVERNWRAGQRGQGLRGEVDCIAWHHNTLCFVEVKTRSSNDFGRPQESVTLAKQRQLSRLANAYVSQHRIGSPCRFDVIEVWLPLTRDQKPRIALRPNAFDYIGF